MTLYHVLLRRAETLERDVEAADEDAAVDRVITEAPGTPKDWEVLDVTPTRDLPETGMRLVTPSFNLGPVCMIPDCGCAGEPHP